MTSHPHRFIDIGINLTDPVFRGRYHGKKAHDDDMQQVLSRAKTAGVTHMLVTSGTLKESKEALSLVNSLSSADLQLYSTVGCHPTRCGEFEKYPSGAEAYLQGLSELIKSNPGIVKAIGECGLDYDRLHFCDKETQIKYFKYQFQLARESGLPMFLHNRNTGSDFYDIIKENISSMTSGGVVHSFTGTLEEMKRLTNLGLYISLNGCSLKSPENLDVVKHIPLHLLLLETDAPWCEIRLTHASSHYLSTIPTEIAPMFGIGKDIVKKREKFLLGSMVKGRNEPCTIGQVAYVVSALRNEGPQTLIDAVYENTRNLFHI